MKKLCEYCEDSMKTKEYNIFGVKYNLCDMCAEMPLRQVKKKK